jgi:hypothetical protein
VLRNLALRRLKSSIPVRLRNRTALQEHVKDKMAAGVQIGVDAAKRFRQVAILDQMVQRVEIARYQINRVRETKRADVLTQQADAHTPAISSGDSQHVARYVDAHNGNVPRSIQIAGE